MAAKTEAAVGLFDDALATFSEAVKAGVKVQEDIGKWWSDALEKAGPMDDWQKRGRAVVSEAIPAAQKNTEDWLKLLDHNYKKSMALLKKAFDAEPTGAAHVRAKAQEIWEESLVMVRDNAQAMAQANLKMMEVWAGMLRKGAVGANGQSAK